VKPVIIIAIAFVFLFSSATIYAQSQYDIPAWVKGVAGFWAEDKITDAEFGEGLSFLIDSGIIKVPKIQELENKIEQLESENAELRKIQNCDDSYPDVCIAPYPPDLDCGEIGYSNFRVVGNDPHGFDRDNDGIGCEVGSPKTEIQEITEKFRVSLGTYSAFILGYGISGGNVQDVFTDRNDFSLSVIIDSVSDGTITLDLPRQIIGAEKQDGSDDTFMVLIDGIEVAYQESDFDFVSRVITINFEQGDTDIKILGTYVA